MKKLATTLALLLALGTAQAIAQTTPATPATAAPARTEEYCMILAT